MNVSATMMIHRNVIKRALHASTTARIEIPKKIEETVAPVATKTKSIVQSILHGSKTAQRNNDLAEAWSMKLARGKYVHELQGTPSYIYLNPYQSIPLFLLLGMITKNLCN